MSRKVKCQICTIFDTKENMVQETNKKYYHRLECHDQFLLKQKEIQEEQEYKMKLATLLEKIYNLETYKLIPPAYWIRLENLRNEYTQSNELGRTYKSGLPYKALFMTYDYCFNVINIDYKKDFDNFVGQMLYDLKIVQNNLMDARSYYTNRVQEEEKMNKTVSIDNVNVYIPSLKEIKYKNSENENDISKFL